MGEVGGSAGRLGGGKHVTSVRGEHCQDLKSKKKTLHISFSMGRKEPGGKKKQTDANQHAFKIQQGFRNDPAQLFNDVTPSLLLLNGLLASE